VQACKSGRNLVYAGKTETGFTDGDERMLFRRLKPLEIFKPPTETKSRVTKFGKVSRWVRPVLQIDVMYRSITEDGCLLRHAQFMGIRERRRLG
jgi:ATP-dependent DNA ligase